MRNLNKDGEIKEDLITAVPVISGCVLMISGVVGYWGIAVIALMVMSLSTLVAVVHTAMGSQ